MMGLAFSVPIGVNLLFSAGAAQGAVPKPVDSPEADSSTEIAQMVDWPKPAALDVAATAPVLLEVALDIDTAKDSAAAERAENANIVAFSQEDPSVFTVSEEGSSPIEVNWSGLEPANVDSSVPLPSGSALSSQSYASERLATGGFSADVANSVVVPAAEAIVQQSAAPAALPISPTAPTSGSLPGYSPALSSDPAGAGLPTIPNSSVPSTELIAQGLPVVWETAASAPTSATPAGTWMLVWVPTGGMPSQLPPGYIPAWVPMPPDASAAALPSQIPPYSPGIAWNSYQPPVGYPAVNTPPVGSLPSQLPIYSPGGGVMGGYQPLLGYPTANSPLPGSTVMPGFTALPVPALPSGSSQMTVPPPPAAPPVFAPSLPGQSQFDLSQTVYPGTNYPATNYPATSYPAAAPTGSTANGLGVAADLGAANLGLPPQPLTDPSLDLQGLYVFQGDESSARARLSGSVFLTPNLLAGGILDVVTGPDLTNDDGIQITELYLATAFPGAPQVRFRLGQLDLTSYFDRNSFAKDISRDFFNSTFQTNPALIAGANVTASRPAGLVQWNVTDDITLSAAAFSSSSSLESFALDGFAGEVGFRTGNLILRGTYVSSKDTAFQGTDERLQGYGVNAEYFFPASNLGLFGRFGNLVNSSTGFSTSTYSLGLNLLDLFMEDDRLGLAYGRNLSTAAVNDRTPDVLEAFYDFEIFPNVRAGFTFQQRNDFTESYAGFRLRGNLDLTPSLSQN